MNKLYDEIDRLNEQLVRATEREVALRRLVQDHCDDEDEIQKMLIPIIGEKKAVHDGHGVVPLPDAIECVIAALRQRGSDG